MPMLNARARLHLALTQESYWRQPSPVTVATAAGATPTAAPDSAPAPIPDGPLRLTDDQLAAVLRAAEPLAIGDRDAFLQDVAVALRGQEATGRCIAWSPRCSGNTTTRRS